MEKLYKFIPLILSFIIGAILFLNPSSQSIFYMMLHPSELPFKLPFTPTELIFVGLGLFVVLPAIIISIIGAFGIEKLRKGKKLLFIIWIILFLIWLYWILILTLYNPMPVPAI